MTAAFSFPTRTGVAQHDGLALLRHVIQYGTTPVDLDAVKLALHTAPLAYLGTPEAHTVAAVRGAVDTLSAAARRLSVEAKALEAAQRARLAKLASLFDGTDDRPNAGPMAPLQPVLPQPPSPDAINPKLDALAQQLATKINIPLDEARKLLVKRLQAAKQAAPEAA